MAVCLKLFEDSPNILQVFFYDLDLDDVRAETNFIEPDEKMECYDILIVIISITTIKTDQLRIIFLHIKYNLTGP